jgi:hypothetical protein
MKETRELPEAGNRRKAAGRRLRRAHGWFDEQQRHDSGGDEADGPKRVSAHIQF